MNKVLTQAVKKVLGWRVQADAIVGAGIVNQVIDPASFSMIFYNHSLQADSSVNSVGIQKTFHGHRPNSLNQ